MTTTQATSQQIRSLRSLLQGIESGFLTTIDEDGSLHSRPMSMSGEIEDDATLWFFTLTSSHKVSEIEQHQQVSVNFCVHEQQIYLSLSGTAYLVQDENKLREKWRPQLTTWFPQGLEETDLSLLKVKINKAEHWESTSSFIPQVDFSRDLSKVGQN